MTEKKMNPGAVQRSGVRVFADLRSSVSDLTRYSRTAKAACIVFSGIDGPVHMTVKGRELWALQELIRVGARGLTSIERSAPRWSHYVFQLRARGLFIETIREEHGGEYPGHHGRYVLRTPVAIGGGA